jgi:hypothetical protein
MTVAEQTKEELIESVDEQVAHLTTAEYEDPALAFAQVAVSALLDLDDDEAYEACEVGVVDADNGPDAFYVDEDGRRAIIVVAKYRVGGDAPLGRPFARELEAAYGRITASKTRTVRGKLGSVARQLNDLRREDPDYPVEVWGVGFGDIRAAAEAELDRIHDDETDNVVFKIFDAARILAAIHERESRDAPAMSEPVTLTLENHFRYSVDEQPEAIVANLDALELAKLERKYGYRLFQANVRYLLRGKQKINEDIQNTLRQPEERDHFWYYNNGIAILCDRFDDPKTTRGKTTVKIHNLQIVNGCQTTATLARTIDALQDADPPVQILARIIAADDESDLSDSIPLYNNRQNAVLDRDLQSNDEVQNRLHSEFRKLTPPWFYERKRGEWEARGSKSRYGPRRIQNDVAAQAYYAFTHDPGVARARKRYLFARKRDNGLYEEIFNLDTSPESLLLPYRLAMYIRPQVAKYRREIKGIRAGQGSAADQKKLDFEWLKFGEQYLIGTIGWHLRKCGRLTKQMMMSLATDRFDDLVDTIYPVAVRDLTLIFRRIALDQPIADGDRRERVDYANYVKGNWSDVVKLLNVEYDLVRDEGMPLEFLLADLR